MRRGSALLLSLVIAGVLALLATAFIITAQVERQAAVNNLRGAQAEAACRAGLAVAIYQIELTANSIYGLDEPGSWHAYFEPGTGDTSAELCPPDTWVNHYDGEKFRNNAVHNCRMAGKRFGLPIAAGGDPAAALKHQKGFASEYYVAVADLDGKLHCNPQYFANLLDDTGANHQTLDMVSVLGITSVLAKATLANDVTPDWSLGQLRGKLAAAGVPAAEYKLNEAEKYFTVYPSVPALAAKGDVGRPPVNVNTARAEVLKAIVFNVPGLAAKADIVAQKLVNERPFANRKEMEQALLELGQDTWPAPCKGLSNDLDETQMNDLFNSLAGDNSLTADESDYDRPAKLGLYSFDFDDSDSRDPTKGTYTAMASEDATVAATWGTEVKFTSRFFHVYTLGRTLSYASSPPRATAERRLHAVYDAATHKVLWLRWNFGAKANMTD